MIFTVFLKNKNIIFKIRRSKVTDYAALKRKGAWSNMVANICPQTHPKPLGGVKISKHFFLKVTLENLCTRKAQSSRGGHSRRVEKMCTLLLKKVINFLIFHFWEYFLLIIVSNIYSFVSA